MPTLLWIAERGTFPYFAPVLIQASAIVALAITRADARMSDVDVTERVRAVIAQRLAKPPSEIGDDESLSALGIASLDMVELLFSLEEEFGIDIPLDATAAGAGAMDSVAAVSRSLSALLDAQG